MASADVPIKGLDVVIEALARLAPQRPELRLQVIGTLREGPTKRMIVRTGLADRVEFRSGLSREAIADTYRRAGLFISASRFEGFGFPPAEAMACGIPVVGLDAPGTRDIVRDGENGALVKTETVEAFGKTLRSTVDAEREERATLSQGARQTAENWSTERCADRYLNLYEEVCKTYRAAHAESGRWNPGRGILEIARLWGKRIAAGIKVLVGAGP